MKNYLPSDFIEIDIDNINRRLLETVILILYYEKYGYPNLLNTATENVNLRMKAYLLYKTDTLFATKVNNFRAIILKIIEQEIF